MFGEARLVSYKPPGKPTDQVATISSSEGVLITLIKASDGTVLYRNLDFDWISGGSMNGIAPGYECQLPPGTYTIGAAYHKFVAGYGITARLSKADQHVTASLRQGATYVVTCDLKGDVGFGPHKWELRLLEQ